jgi:hypothetical protein
MFYTIPLPDRYSSYLLAIKVKIIADSHLQHNIHILYKIEQCELKRMCGGLGAGG